MGSKNLLSPSDRNRIFTRSINTIFMILIIVLLLSSCCSVKEKTVTVRDTVLTYVNIDTINFDTEPKIIYDSTLPDIVTKPFEFKIDTIIQSVVKNKMKYDTVKINYAYPDNFLNFSYLPEPDSNFMEIVKETVTFTEELTFWNYAPYVISTALIFFVLGYIVAKFR